jgi:hypothetical protein
MIFSRWQSALTSLRTSAAPASGAAANALRLSAWALLLIGVASRLSPLFDVDNRLLWQFMSEDGYLMQTIARNMALGLGMSSSAGTIPTNGVQPLATFVFAALHWLAGGSKTAGIALNTLLSLAVSMAAAWFLYRVAARVFAGFAAGRGMALLCALIWFAAPRVVGHSMNGLETGIYYLAILITLDFYQRYTMADAPLTWRHRLVLGAWLGIAFLARNDAVFFIAGLLVAHGLMGGNRAGGGLPHRCVDAVVCGLISLVVASPWLAHNYALFGSIVPISGISESHGAALGSNLSALPANFFEASFSDLLLPLRLKLSAPVVAITAVLVLASLAGFWTIVARHSLQATRFFITGVLFAAAVSIYYGVFFGAAHFIPRYTSPLSVFMWTGTVAVVVVAMHAAFRSAPAARAGLASVALLATAASLAFAVSGFTKGTTNGHRQVVDWVSGHVPDDVWVGAVQTGTVGYFHDRTINLDGKVNPAALRAVIDHGSVLDYVVDSKIDYIADWSGVGGWMDMRQASPRFTSEFELLLRDEASNLSAMRRIHPKTVPQTAALK